MHISIRYFIAIIFFSALHIFGFLFLFVYYGNLPSNLQYLIKIWQMSMDIIISLSRAHDIVKELVVCKARRVNFSTSFCWFQITSVARLFQCHINE